MLKLILKPCTHCFYLCISSWHTTGYDLGKPIVQLLVVNENEMKD